MKACEWCCSGPVSLGGERQAPFYRNGGSGEAGALMMGKVPDLGDQSLGDMSLMTFLLEPADEEACFAPRQDEAH